MAPLRELITSHGCRQDISPSIKNRKSLVSGRKKERKREEKEKKREREREKETERERDRDRETEREKMSTGRNQK